MQHIHRWLQELYSALPNYNYGWWLTTRHHLDVASLVTAVQFLYGRFGRNDSFLSNDDYNDLQRALGRNVPSGGAKMVLNRQMLLNMWRPLKLVERNREDRINPFRLTDYGLELAQTTEPRRVLESILREIIFVNADWTRPTTMNSYEGISVRPHRVLKTALDNLEGYLTRDEYRLFIARMRRGDENSVSQAIMLIRDFRSSSQAERNSLLSLELPIFPSGKSFPNWVDMDLHTFSLFALGTQFRRIDKVLVLAGTAVDATAANAFVFPVGNSSVQATIPENLRRPLCRHVSLRTPDFDPELDTPPTPSIEANNGQEAEGFVKRLLEANGFEVRDFSRFRGYGFDLGRGTHQPKMFTIVRLNPAPLL